MKELTEFNNGGTHEENPLGGIPLKNGVTVEEGETKQGSFIYSNRIAINDEEVKKFNLPNYLKNKTIAEASKIINNKFKDRNDKTSNSTKAEFLNRLSQAQEYIKEKEQLINNSLNLNSKQMFLGGDFNAIQASNIVGNASTLAGANPAIGLGLNLAGGFLQNYLNKKNEYKQIKQNAFDVNSQFSDKTQMYLGGDVDDIIAGSSMKQKGVNNLIGSALDVFNNKNLLPKDNSNFNKDVESPDLTGLNTNVKNQEKAKDNFNFKNSIESISDFIGNNSGKALKYSPVLMNSYQMSKLNKPNKTVYNTLSNKYNPNYVDEAAIQNTLNSELNNSINAISASGGSPGAIRSSILGSYLNKSKAMSDAYLKMNDINRDIEDKRQSFNLNIDQYNNQILNKAIDEFRMDEANYRNQKSKFLGAIGTDLGSIGKEEINKQQIAEAYGYSWDGKYLVDKKTGKKFDWNQIMKPTQAKYGGMIKPRLK